MGGGTGLDNKNRGVVLFNDKSQIEIPPQGNQVTIPTWARHAVGNYGDVLRNGTVLASPVGQECNGQPPRTFGGISQNGRVLILGTADAYNITGTNYVGFTCQEIGALPERARRVDRRELRRRQLHGHVHRRAIRPGCRAWPGTSTSSTSRRI